MDDIDVNNSSAIDVVARALYDTLRVTNGANKEIRVNLQVRVGGRDYFRNIHSPVLEGDELVTHEVPKRDF
jgi:hypothetical protein